MAHKKSMKRKVHFLFIIKEVLRSKLFVFKQTLTTFLALLFFYKSTMKLQDDDFAGNIASCAKHVSHPLKIICLQHRAPTQEPAIILHCTVDHDVIITELTLPYC